MFFEVQIFFWMLTVVCPAGQFRNTNNMCQDCDSGYYQSQPGQTTCQSCAANYTTYTKASTSPENCTSKNEKFFVLFELQTILIERKIVEQSLPTPPYLLLFVLQYNWNVCVCEWRLVVIELVANSGQINESLPFSRFMGYSLYIYINIYLFFSIPSSFS